jgi:hypothetical protein
VRKRQALFEAIDDETRLALQNQRKAFCKMASGEPYRFMDGLEAVRYYFLGIPQETVNDYYAQAASGDDDKVEQFNRMIAGFNERSFSFEMAVNGRKAHEDSLEIFPTS